MIKNTNIVIFGLQPWDIQIGSNCKNIALELSKHNRVIYVNRPLDRISWLKGKKDPISQNRIAVLKKEKEPLEQINENLQVLTPTVIMESVQWLNSKSLFQYLTKKNSQKLAKNIKQSLDELNIKEFILFNDSAMFQGIELKKILKPQLFIYYIRDYLIAQPYFKKHGAVAEEKLIKQADWVVTNSTYLAKYAKKYNEKSFFIGQGCDLEMFQPQDIKFIPPALSVIKKPIIGYVGNLTSQRLDIDLLVYLAKSKPNWSLVLVGGEDEKFKKSLLHELDNVHFLGFQKPESLPAFIHGFDICINPQLLNEMSIGNYPRKIDEYLAMGKPVVATKTEGMLMFSDHVSLAVDKHEFEKKIEQLLKNNSTELSEERIKFANSHSWENSVNIMAELLQ
ncbi:MAG: Glycosyl transferase, group 1 [uncultured Aureispira sp.]|uniref:Glycosyl transferase, group 1 n=1 Tax=uncultured Aureispira sp. TaxID=1331704 RepID=A0A6S6TND0_9BACT|nr:MAG: Glycosyl transferase, group 1 [uncultured Aureispira sp.]